MVGITRSKVIHCCVFLVVVVNDLVDDRMLSRTAHWLGWWLLRTHDAQEVQQQRQGWEELGGFLEMAMSQFMDGFCLGNSH